MISHGRPCACSIVLKMPAMQPCGKLPVNCLSTEPLSWISAYDYAYSKVTCYPVTVQVKTFDDSQFN